MTNKTGGCFSKWIFYNRFREVIAFALKKNHNTNAFLNESPAFLDDRIENNVISL